MFKLLSFSLKGHSILKNIEIDFVEQKEIYLEDAPYTSIIIGANGVGKSQILRAIAEIFREMENLKLPDYTWRRGFNFSLKYVIEEITYCVCTDSFINYDINGQSRNIICYKNIPKNFDELSKKEKSVLLIGNKNIPLPGKLLVSSIMLNDRFTFEDSKPIDFYQYLGIRRSASQTSTQTFARKTIRYIFDAAKVGEYKQGLSNLLDFMGLERNLKISYSLKYKPVFEKTEPDANSFHNFFTAWWNIPGVRRSKERAPWGKWYYEKIKDDKAKINKLIALINVINKKLTEKPNSSRTKEYVISVFSERQDFDDFNLVEELIHLDILQLNGIQIKKKNITGYGIEQSSSGEYHLLLSLLGVFSRIEQNSLVLIDEPEISLHPNWQMRYIHELKQMFFNYASCHFILATHSHFIVSDLKDTSSSVNALTLKMDGSIDARLMHSNTYGWSAEQILLDIFKVSTTRNYYIAEKIGEILEEVSLAERDEDKIKKLVNELLDSNIIHLSEKDPLKPVINRLIEKYA